LALAVFAAFAAPQTIEASTSANATIFNQVTVEYQSGTNVLTASADVSVTVATLAAAPTVYVDTPAQTTTAGAAINYAYTVRANSNGPDTYTLTTPVNSINIGISAPANTPSGNSVSLWGGIVISSGAGTINLPGGSTVGLADGDTVELTVGGSAQRYTVAVTTAGSAATALAAEVQAVLTLTPISGAPAITAGNVVAGTQIGEYASITLQQTAGTPTTAGTDGTHVTNLTFTTTATDINDVAVSYTTQAGDSNEVTTTVSSPSLNITKLADKANAKPGETITYTITVQNTHAAAAASNVEVTDPVPTYTAYVANSTRLNNITVDGDGATSPLSGGLLIDADSGRADGAVASGTLNAGETATIIFSVTVQ
jgi:uncharacterized repeat protein (TIGR01451 family)